MKIIDYISWVGEIPTNKETKELHNRLLKIAEKSTKKFIEDKLGERYRNPEDLTVEEYFKNLKK